MRIATPPLAQHLVHATSPLSVEHLFSGWLQMLQSTSANEHPYKQPLASYIKGFGAPYGSNSWVGLDTLYDVTKDGHVTLRVEVLTYERLRLMGEYRGFKVISVIIVGMMEFVENFNSIRQ